MRGAWREPDPPAEWRGITVRFPYCQASAVGPVDLRLGSGERLLLLGASGSGKSTLLNTLTGLVPQVMPAQVDGRVLLFGHDVAAGAPADWAGTVARFFQDADQTLCGMRVEDEIAFALENRALPQEEIVERVGRAMRLAGLPEAWRGRRSTTLSGGEKQLVALAACLAQDTPVLVADEPTAHLAPAAAARLHGLLMAKGARRSILIVDHRLDGLIEQVDRVAVLGRTGTIMAEGAPRRLFRDHFDRLAATGVWIPAAIRLDRELARADLAARVAPLSVSEALAPLDPPPAGHERAAAQAVARFVDAHVAAPVHTNRTVLASLTAASCAPLFGPIVLSGVNLALGTGEAVAIVGPNGAGKSTLGASLAGLLRLRSGRRDGPPAGMAFQNPDSQFVTGSVRQELAGVLRGKGARKEAPGTADRLLQTWDLADLAERHPLELSQGQKRRLSLALVTAGRRWPLLVLDEPTAGLDAAGTAMIANHVERLRASGLAIAVVTHDMDFALRLCARLVLVGEGRIIADGPAAELMRDRALLARAGLCGPAIAAALDWQERYA